MMDISTTILADSTQINAADLAEPMTVTITEVTRGNPEQPVNLMLAEFPGKAFRPCKTVRRLLVQAWGKDATQYTGRRLTLYNDRSVKWGGQQVGGVRVSAMSHIDKPLVAALPEARGKLSRFTVDPLPDEPTPVALTDGEIDAATTTDELRALWGAASPEQQDRIKARVAELTEGAS